MFFHDLSTEAMPEMQGEEFLPPISAWSTLGGVILTGAFGISLLLAALIKMPLAARINGQFRYEADPVSIQASAEGTVESLYVQVGDRVNQGDMLARLSLREREDIGFIKVEQDQLQAQMSGQIAPLNAQLEAAERAVEKTKEALEDPQSQLKDSQDSRRELLDGIPPELADELEETLNGADFPLEAQIEALQNQKAQQEDKVKQIQAQINGIRQEFDARIQANDERVTFLQELQEADSYIKADTAGIVTSLSKNTQVTKGITFASITPVSDLIMQLQIPSDHIPNVNLGDQASVRVQGCPHTEYGVLKGEVANITDVQSGNGSFVFGAGSDMLNSSASSTVRQMASVTFETTSLGREGIEPCELEVGMEGRVDIIYKETTILRWLLHKMRVIVDL